MLFNTLLNQMGPSGTSEGKSSVCLTVYMSPLSLSLSPPLVLAFRILGFDELVYFEHGGEAEGTGCACEAENSHVSRLPASLLVISLLLLHFPPRHLSLHHSSFPIILCIEALIQFLCGLPAPCCNDEGIFQVGKRLLSSPWGTCN